MLVKKYQSQKLSKKPPNFLFQKKTVLNFLSKVTMQRYRPKQGRKLVSGKRLYWKIRHDFFSNDKAA